MYDMDLEFEKIYQNILTYIHKKEDLIMIKRAYDFVKKEQFFDLFRSCKFPYINDI